MEATFQCPRPEIKIYRPNGELVAEFDIIQRKGLQAYSFGTSINDVKGQFSLTFYPDESDYADPIFNKIEELDIVEIYESKNLFDQSNLSNPNFSANPVKASPVVPTFTGVVRKKRYAAQVGDSSMTRRFVVSGHSVAGLIADFRLNMDVSAMAITKQLASQAAISKELTVKLQSSDNKPLKLKDIVDTIWKAFLALSNQYGKLSNPLIAKIITDWMGEDFFDIDENLEFHYPLGNVFNAKSTNSFYDIIDGIISAPVYERFAYMDRKTGMMRVKIRECPFDPDDWDALQYKDPKKKDEVLDCHQIPPRLVKSFDIEQSDDEVYTVFFSYLNGYPVQEQKLLTLMAQEEQSCYPDLVWDQAKYEKYGYRPLFAHFIGYTPAKEGDKETGTMERLQKLNERLKKWYGNLELMYNGSVTLATDLSMDMPAPGETVKFLYGEFYVSGAEHRWSYLGNPETVVSLSRGGNYSYTAGAAQAATDPEPEPVEPIEPYTGTVHYVNDQGTPNAEGNKILDEIKKKADEIVEKAQSYNVYLEGYINPVFTGNPTAAKKEEIVKELVGKRIDTVKQALAQKGITENITDNREKVRLTDCTTRKTSYSAEDCRVVLVTISATPKQNSQETSSKTDTGSTLKFKPLTYWGKIKGMITQWIM